MIVMIQDNILYASC